MAKGKLRHIAISVPDKEKAAQHKFCDLYGIVFDITTHGWDGAKR